MQEKWQEVNDLICKIVSNVIKHNSINDDKVFFSIRSHVGWVEVYDKEVEHTITFWYLDSEGNPETPEIEKLYEISKDFNAYFNNPNLKEFSNVYP